MSLSLPITHAAPRDGQPSMGCRLPYGITDLKAEPHRALDDQLSQSATRRMKRSAYRRSTIPKRDPHSRRSGQCSRHAKY